MEVEWQKKPQKLASYPSRIIRLVKLFPSTVPSQLIKMFQYSWGWIKVSSKLNCPSSSCQVGSSDNNYLWTHPEAYTKILFHHAYVIAFAILIFIFQTDREYYCCCQMCDLLLQKCYHSKKRNGRAIVCVTMLIRKSADFWHRLIDLLLIEEGGYFCVTQININ